MDPLAGNTKLLVSLSKTGDWFGEEARFTRLLLIDMSAGTVELLGNDEPVIEGDDVISSPKMATHWFRFNTMFAIILGLPL